MPRPGVDYCVRVGTGKRVLVHGAAEVRHHFRGWLRKLREAQKTAARAGDLALAAALLSSFHDRPLPKDLVFAGEVGLLGEVRPVPGTRQRLEESARLGFNTGCVAPGSLDDGGPKGMKVHEVPELAQLARRFVD